MKQAEIICRLHEQATAPNVHGNNGAVLLRLYESTTPEERKARRAAAVERYRQQVSS